MTKVTPQRQVAIDILTDLYGFLKFTPVLSFNNEGSYKFGYFIDDDNGGHGYAEISVKKDNTFNWIKLGRHGQRYKSLGAARASLHG